MLFRRNWFWSSLLGLLLALECACGGGSASNNTSDPNPPPTVVPQFDHVLLVIEENHSYSDVVGNSQMPYLNSLIKSYAIATQYYANFHPSLPNYFMLTTGELITVADSYDQPVTQNNVVRALIQVSKTWKCYAESLPSIGYLGSDVGNYLQHHNPCVYFSDVQTRPALAGNVVPFTQFAVDLQAGTLPDYSLVIPNAADDAHSCPDGTTTTCTDSQMLAQADSWLQTNIDPLLKSPAFQNSLLIITFDESEQSDIVLGGGHVATLVISPKVKPGFQSVTFYQHQSTLRLMLNALGVSNLPGDSSTAPSMAEFFH